jgi:hypothetical protein
MLSRHADDLAALDRDPAPLFAWLGERLTSPLLGRYFEALVGFWIQHLLRARRFESSIVVSRDRRTLGELDFVFEDSAGLPWHWEVAVKFYLCKEVVPGVRLRTDAYWGAMTQDRLDKKLSVIFDRQLGMPYSVEGRGALEAKGFAPAFAAGAPGSADVLRSRLLMKGMLFYPLSSWDWVAGELIGAEYPAEVSPRHGQGWWATGLPGGGGCSGAAAWTVLKRKQWLSPFWAPAEFEPLRTAQACALVAAHFGGEVSPLMFAALARDEDGSWSERHRGLVMWAGWPGTNVPDRSL